MPNHDTLQFVSASSFSLKDFTQLFNRSFEQYFYPMNFSPAAFAARVRLESLDLHHSVVMLIDDVKAGQATLGLRGDTAWCGGFGIIPEYRAQGLAKQLFEAFITQVRATGAKRLRLEVLHKNAAAQKVYFGAGLKVQRELLLLEWKRESLVPARVTEGIRLQAVNMPEIVKHFYAFHPVAAAWQQDLPSFMTQPELLQLGYYVQGQLKSYILLTLRESSVRIVDAGALEVSDLVHPLAYLQSRYTHIVRVNEPQDSPLTEAFLQCQFTEFDRQFELEMPL